MSTCFIFFDAATYTPDADLPKLFWAVRLDDAGEIDVALSEHTPEEIHAMQAGARTVVVLPTSVASIHFLNFPKLSMRKVREAIPYALEEVLAEPVQETQVAFERDTDNVLHYRAVALNKLRLRTWITALETLQFEFDAITLDWFALAPGEMCATNTDLLVRGQGEEDTINGALSPFIAAEYIKSHLKDDLTKVSFDDSLPLLSDVSETAGSYRLFIATRLLKTSFVNVCQGDFQQKSQGRGYLYWYGLCGGLLTAWFLSVLSINAFLLHQLHTKQKVVDGEIKTLYHAFFPEATQVISPRFRIERLLETNAADVASPFWALLNKLAKVFLQHPLKIEHIQFRDQGISVSLIADSFAALEAFEQQLKKQQVSVKQIEASTRDDQVVSTLELQL
ncbi:MAG: hypothetical protein K0U37_00860 [Gammaproteobacteria bacterium]|nr:hypothetical protein [Gammaproteobacteria bacterium]